MNKIPLINESECSCKICQSMCMRPCWGTPEEIKKLIDNGYGDRLYVDYWGVSSGTDIEILCGALKGKEGEWAPFFPSSAQGCTFWKDGLCELHDKRLKPAEGRHAHHSTCDSEDSSIHKQIAMLWDTEDARKLIEDWREKYGKSLEDDEDEDESYENSFFGKMMSVYQPGKNTERLGPDNEH